MIISATFPIATVSEANHRDKWEYRTNTHGKSYRVSGYMVAAQRHRLQRDDAYMMCVKEISQHLDRRIILPSTKITLELTRIATRKLDKDNLYSSLKHVVDGICLWLGIDDGEARFTLICTQRMQAKSNEVEVKLTIV